MMKSQELIKKAITLARRHFAKYPSGREWHVVLADGNIEDHHVLDMSYTDGAVEDERGCDPGDPDSIATKTSRELWKVMCSLSEKGRCEVYAKLWEASVKWGPSRGGEVVSKCGRFRVTPKYWGRCKPVAYQPEEFIKGKWEIVGCEVDTQRIGKQRCEERVS